MNKILLALFFTPIFALAQAPSVTTESPAEIKSKVKPDVKAEAPSSEPPLVSPTIEKEKNPLTLFGDFRYRQQFETQQPNKERRMQRLQARFGVLAQVQEDLKLTLRLMTGTAANSGNQTLGDSSSPGMPRRNFGLDQSFFDYQPLPILNLYGGKMPQPFTFAGKNQMLLDRDITLEGLALKLIVPIEDKFDFFLQGGSFMIRENYDSTFGEDQTDNMLNAVQLGFQWKPDDWALSFGYGSFSYAALKDSPPANIGTGGKANGNTVDINGNYPTNFDIEEVFIEIKRKIKNFDISFFGESLKNKDVDALGKANAYGLILGYKEWNFTWTKEEVEKDSVLGLFTDSDFAGGQTSSRGTIMSLGYKFTKRVQAIYTVYKNQNLVEISAMNYDRTHIDLLINF